MSLTAAFAAIRAGCVHVPQQGYFHTEPPARYQVTFARPGQRVFYRFNYDVTLVWDCPSPPAVIRISMYEHPEISVNTDPLFHCDCFLTDCSSPGTALDTSDWFPTVFLNANFKGVAPTSIYWIHIQNWNTNSGSVGLAAYNHWPPVWPM